LGLWREVGLRIDLSGTGREGGEKEGEGEEEGRRRERILEVWRSVRRRMEGGAGGNAGGGVEGVGDLKVLVKSEEEREWLRRKFEVWSGWKETKVLVVGKVKRS